jgi:hypothetical protein
VHITAVEKANIPVSRKGHNPTCRLVAATPMVRRTAEN